MNRRCGSMLRHLIVDVHSMYLTPGVHCMVFEYPGCVQHSFPNNPNCYHELTESVPDLATMFEDYYRKLKSYKCRVGTYATVEKRRGEDGHLS